VTVSSTCSATVSVIHSGSNRAIFQPIWMTYDTSTPSPNATPTLVPTTRTSPMAREDRYSGGEIDDEVDASRFHNLPVRLPEKTLEHPP
jgi:hypothetical protein